MEGTAILVSDPQDSLKAEASFFNLEGLRAMGFVPPLF